MRAILDRLIPFPDAGFLPTPADPSSPRSSRCRVSHRSRLFDGHFEGAAILPGVAHIALAVRACAAETNAPGVLRGLRDIRFRRPIGPGDEIEIVLVDDREPSSVRFEIRSGSETASTGVLLFELPDGNADG